MRLKDRVAIVTGAGSGFGAGIARRFAEEGAKVLIADIDADGGRRVADAIGEAARFSACDVSDGRSVGAAVEAARDTWNRLDIVVNNAGYATANGPMLEVAEADFDRIFDVNVKALYHTARTAVPLFREQGGGCFVNVASTGGVRPRPGLVWYNGSKAAVIGLTKSMAIELAPEGIRVNALNPVAGDTGMLHLFMGEDTPAKREQFRASVPMGRLSTPDDIADAALFLASDEARFITGTALEVDGGRCI